MKLVIDTKKEILVKEENGKRAVFNLYSPKAFEILSQQWLKVGWDQKYSYSYTWLNRPVIQLPDDLLRMQEVLCTVRPTVVIETGIAHGGSLIFYASILTLLGEGRVIGIDIAIKPPNRKAIEAHKLSSRISLVEGSSTEISVRKAVEQMIKKNDRVLVVLDSCHTKRHVEEELNAYYKLVTKGSYLVATDGIMKDLSDTPRGKKEWIFDNPVCAVRKFLKQHPEFRLERPPRIFNESKLPKDITYWPSAYLKRIS